MNKKNIVEISKPRAFTDADFDEDCGGWDIVLIDARERSQRQENYADYIWGSSEPLLASVYKGSKGDEVYAVEMTGIKNDTPHFDVLGYLRNKKYIPVEVVMSDDLDSPSSYIIDGGEQALVVRFDNHKDSNILYQTNENVFFGFDDAGILSEFIYLGRAMAEDLLGKKIETVLEKYPTQAIKEKMEAILKNK